MAVYHSKTGVGYLSTSGTGNASPVTLSAWTLSLATDRVETTSMGDANKTYVQGLRDITGTLTWFWDDTDDSPFDASESSDGLKLYLYPTSLAPTFYFYGPAWLDTSIELDVNGAVRCSGTFAANGAWGRMP